MKRLVLASCAALLILAPVLAFAQSRPGGGGTTVGSASPRGGDTGGSSSTTSSSSSGTASERGGSTGGSSSSSGSFSSPVSGGGSSMRSNYAGPRSGEATSAARPRNASASVGQPVPASERARGDRPVYGQAVPRGSKPTPSNTGVVVGGYNPYGYDYGYGNWYGSPYGYYGSPYGWFGSYGYGYPYYWDTWGGTPWGMFAMPWSAYSGYLNEYAGSAAYTTGAIGSIKLKVQPKSAEVYVDGTYYGQVDNYDGAFQHLDLSGGTHRVEIRATGYQTLQLEMRVLPGKTITYTGELKPAK